MEERVKIGSSLIVPSVQELAKNKLQSIPPRYIHPFDQQDLVISQSDSSPEIPVIDGQRLLSPESADSELPRLHLACKDWGFFQLINHGVSPSLLQKVKREIRDFFNLPMSEKKKYWQSSEDVEGFGQAFVVSEDQKLDWADMFFMTTLPIHLRKPHLFPQLPLPFRLDGILGKEAHPQEGGILGKEAPTQKAPSVYLKGVIQNGALVLCKSCLYLRPQWESLCPTAYRP